LHSTEASKDRYMSYLVLARKWRPQTFDEIRGQEHIVRALRNGIASGRIAHAYIFTGTRGVGKTSAARVFAKALNCETGPTPSPCGKCDSCLSIPEGRHPDVLEIDGASNNGVEDVRRLRDIVRYPPSQGKYSIYIIDEVHMLSTGAFNALLKTLEEPPPHVVFIFATTDPHKVPVTILSRCQQYDFKRLSTKELTGLLSDIATSEKISIEDKSLLSIAREAEGSVRDSQSLLDQVVSYAGDNVTYQDVKDVLGVVDRDLLFSLAEAILLKDGAAVLSLLSEAERYGVDVKRFSIDLQDLFRDLAVTKSVEDSAPLTDLVGEEASRAQTLVGEVKWEELHALFDMLSIGVERLRLATRPGVLLEMTLLKMAKMPPLISLAELPERAAAAAVTAGRVMREKPPIKESGAAENVEHEEQPPTANEQQREVAYTAARDDIPPVDSYESPPEEVDAKEDNGEPAPLDENRSVDKPQSPEALFRAIVERLGPFGEVVGCHAKVVLWDEAKGHLAIEAQSDHRISVENKADEIADIAGKLTGRRVRVEVVVPKGQESSAQRARRESDLERKHRREMIADPVVQHLQRSLEAEIEEVKVDK